MTATASGSVTAGDFAEFLEVMRGARALSYRKLFDGSKADFVMDDHEVLGVGVNLRDSQQEPLGALAVVLADESARRLARMLGILATAKRPMRLFRSRRAANDGSITSRPRPGRCSNHRCTGHEGRWSPPTSPR